MWCGWIFASNRSGGCGDCDQAALYKISLNSLEGVCQLLRIYLARHGQDVDNANGVLNGHRDLPLTDVGLAQAAEVANKIKDAGLVFDIIISSPLSRAYQTAQIIAEVNGLSAPKIMNELIERDFGIMTGKHYSQVAEICGNDVFETETITYFLSPEGAESFPALMERAAKLLAHLEENYPDASILLVTHGDFGKMIYAQYYQLDWKDVLRLFHFGNSELLLLSPDSAASDAHVFKIIQHNN
ncbi:hypothetical protein B7Y94_05985 [Candidatus Saccharibacteria bacterium 32-49-12]|nr:MAG: hypothetical protein B7Y94_05985 [Candidatus Saccharibacteria bacterium 32-49-12]